MTATTPPPRGWLRALRGFTLIELIVAILILGVLAAVATVGYQNVTDRSRAGAAQANLRQIATATLAWHLAEQSGELTRTGLITALRDSSIEVVPGPLADAAWTLGGRTFAPDSAGEYAVAFDDGHGVDVNNDAGARAAVVTSAGAGQGWARVISYSGDVFAGAVPAGTTPTDVLTGGEALPEEPDPDAGGSGGGPTAQNDTVTTLSGWVTDVDVTANDTTVGAVTGVTDPTNGTATIAADGTVTYLSDPGFEGADVFTYTTEAGPTAAVTLTVNPLFAACDGGALCPAEPPSAPRPITDPVAAPLGNTFTDALAAFPAPAASGKHYMYALTQAGGIFWVEDTGNIGSGGCASDNTGATAGTFGLGGAPSCETGWLYGNGTFAPEAAAMIAAQGPGHDVGDPYTYDTMFVADTNGLWYFPVNASSSQALPAKLLDSAQFDGAITSLDGHQCYSGSTPAAGNCLWFATNAGSFGQINVDTSAVTTLLSGEDAMYYGHGALDAISITSEAGQPVLVLVTETGHIVRYSPDGIETSFSEYDWHGGYGNPVASILPNDGSFATTNTYEPGAWRSPAVPSAALFDVHAGSGFTALAQTRIDVFGTRQVAGQMYGSVNLGLGKSAMVRIDPNGSVWRLF